ncbi:MAG: tetratricopeptide repeat protein [Marinobacter sp.]|uniref:YfgM family protein n=1 Tax=Marinobacter sp. TaxID=50741 RepID=UPI00299F10DF|nr:tetratricopeptide repeat protein [Marinobacter sp.]MDX1635055.1 tetratricopeptide repeat protein [Marinobacter sp.]
MAEMRTEEEQVEAIKNWWKKNGSALLIGVGAALAIVFGWQAWQDSQAEARSQAAAQFARLLGALNQDNAEQRQETVAYVAGQLRENYADSAYAVYGTLVLAQQQLLEQDDAAAAVSSLQWALENVEQGGPVGPIVRHRLAQAQFAAGNADAALATLREGSVPPAYSALFAELEGDILVAQERRDEARQAYRRAREAMGNQVNGLLELKMADLAIGEDA